MLPQTKSFRMPHACDMRYFMFHAAFITCTGIKEGDIVIMGSDGVFDNLYLVARCCEMLVVILPHAALFQWWHFVSIPFLSALNDVTKKSVVLYIITHLVMLALRLRHLGSFLSQDEVTAIANSVLPPSSATQQLATV